MKNRVIGILIFLFFVLVPFLLEGGDLLRMFAPSPILIVFGPAIGLTVAHCRKGMDRQTVLKKAKKYLLVSGFLGTLLGLTSIMYIAPSATLDVTRLLRQISTTLIATFYGFLSAYIVDVFIEE